MRDSWRFWVKLGFICLLAIGCSYLQQLINAYVEKPTIDQELIAAAANLDGAKVERALSCGASLRAQDMGGCTALTYAVQRGDVKVTRRLLDAGADINARDINGITPLMWAVNSQSLPLVKFLCQRGADRHARNDSNRTVLEQAEQSGCDEICKFLREIDKQRSLSCSD